MAIDLRKYVGRFVEEARDHIDKLNAGLAELATGDADKACVDAIFRSVHTVKGSSRMLKLDPVTQTAHKLEDVMSALRDGGLAFSPSLGQLLGQAADALAAMVDALAENPDGQALPPADQALCAALARAVEAGGDASGPADGEPRPETGLPGETAPPGPQAPSPAAAITPPCAGSGSAGRKDGDPVLKSVETVRVRLAKLDELIKLMGEVVSSHAGLRQRLSEIRALDRDLARALPEPQAARLHAFARAFADDVQDQERLKTDLHDKMLVMRMLPVSILFEPAARLVRELARSVGKQVECVVSGAQIELDRQVIDKLADPVVHLVRNSVDHGVETPQMRLAAGKPAQGRLRLGARQDGGFVVMEVADDGGGVPLAAVRDKAVKRGLVSPERAAAMTDQEAVDLIFLPGFSTSPLVTDLSGRGVGMDVVKRCIVDELRGVITVETRPGAGTTFSLRLPLSLAVMRVVLVQAGGMAFAFTAQYVDEVLRLPREALLVAAGREVVVVRDAFLPVAGLAALAGAPPPPARPGRAGAQGPPGLLFLVLRVRGEKIALRVDDLLDERDMVIKTLPAHMRALPMVSGMVTTGANELVCVLHAPTLFDLARRTGARAEEAPGETAGRAARYRILVVDDSLNTREIERDVLEAHGYDVTLAEDGLDGLRKALNQEQAFDAVLTDVEMPNMDGFTLTERLRQDERYRNKPIVIVTSREKEEDKRRGVQAGADAYIVKGDFARSNLADTLGVLLG